MRSKSFVRPQTSNPPARRGAQHWIASLSVLSALAYPQLGNAAANNPEDANLTGDFSGGPVKLSPAARNAGEIAPGSALQAESQAPAAPYIASEFERYVQKIQGSGPSTTDKEGKPVITIRRFGAELMAPVAGPIVQESATQIPSDYLVGIGDEIQVTLWGSVDADLRLSVDRGGRITLPRVGPVLVAGLRYADLNAAIDQRISQVFKNYKLSTSLGRLRSIRVYVTGFTQRPGAYTVSSLATLVNALMRAGGPSAAGSFRNIELKRAGKIATRFDFYDLLMHGDKSTDITLQAEDVIHIGPVGPEVALLGSVNKPAIFELKANESLEDLLAMAGGFTSVADRHRLSVEHLDARTDERVLQLTLPADAGQKPRNGDVIRAFSAVEAMLPLEKQNKRVLVEGEVRKPGEYLLPPNSTLNDAIQAAGGLTAKAYVFGTELDRESVRLQQDKSYDRALQDMETQLALNVSGSRTTTADEAAGQTAKSQSITSLIERLRKVRPTGRVVLQLPTTTTTLPDLAVENADRITIPARPDTVSVFGSVYNTGSYLYSNQASVGEILKLAGGPTKGADVKSIFVLRANGSVISARQNYGGWLTAGDGVNQTSALPGDTIYVPEELNKTLWIQDVKDWTQILANFGLSMAAFKTLGL